LREKEREGDRRLRRFGSKASYIFSSTQAFSPYTTHTDDSSHG